MINKFKILRYKKTVIYSLFILAVAVSATLTGCAALMECAAPTECAGKKEKTDTSVIITNVSYDPTREFYEEYNKLFSKWYKSKYGTDINVIQSHGGSGAQARSVVEGCNADVVTLALEHDITLIEITGLIEQGWIDEFDSNSAPYTSTMVFLVRKGNEKDIHDWEDLAKEGVSVITPDPKSSGGACWNFLAAWSYGLEHYSDETQVQNFVKRIYDNVTVMDSGARAATTTFVENGMGDVLISWENEAMATIQNYPDKYELITPSVSILAQPSVAIVDDNVKANHTAEESREYLEYLYSDEAQRLICRYGYRCVNSAIMEEYADKFNLDMKLYTIEDFGGWNEVYKKFFEDEAIFDTIMEF